MVRMELLSGVRLGSFEHAHEANVVYIGTEDVVAYSSWRNVMTMMQNPCQLVAMAETAGSRFYWLA